MNNSIKILNIKALIKTSQPIADYTGKLTKTLFLKIVPELALMYPGLKGVFKNYSITPPFDRLKNEFIFPSMDTKPEVSLDGVYEMFFAGTKDLVNIVAMKFREQLHVKHTFIFKNSKVTIEPFELDVAEPRSCQISDAGKITVAIRTPALLSNPLIPSRDARKIFPSAINLFWIPYLIAHNVWRHDINWIIRAYLDLETVLSETRPYRFKRVVTKYGNKLFTGIVGRITFKVYKDLGDNVTRSMAQMRVLNAIKYASSLGIGSSRSSGFGTVTIKCN